MKNLTFILALLFSIYFGQAVAQDYTDVDPYLIELKGKILSKEDSLPVPYVHVVNMRNHGGTTTDARGNFSLEMLNVDSLGISAIGFMKEFVHVPLPYNADSTFTIYISPIRFAIGEVEVKGKSNELHFKNLGTGKPVDIDPELRGDAFNSKPPWYAAIFAPASFIQYYTSRREKEKREVRKVMVSEKRWEYLSKYYNKDIVMELTGLDEAEADSFMVYFNSKGMLNETDNDYEVREAIKHQFRLYQQEKQEVEKQESGK